MSVYVYSSFGSAVENSEIYSFVLCLPQRNQRKKPLTEDKPT